MNDADKIDRKSLTGEAVPDWMFNVYRAMSWHCHRPVEKVWVTKIFVYDRKPERWDGRGSRDDGKEDVYRTREAAYNALFAEMDRFVSDRKKEIHKMKDKEA